MESNLMGKLPLKEHIKNVRKILKVIQEIDSTYFLTTCVVHIANAMIIYINLLLSSYVLNALSAKKEFMTIMSVVLASVMLTFMLHMVASFIWNRLEVRSQKICDLYHCMLEEKMMNMDFSRIDSPEVKELRKRTEQDNNWGAGLHSVFWYSNGFLYSCINITGAIVFGIPVLQYMLQTRSYVTVMILLVLLVVAFVGHKAGAYFKKAEEYFMYHIPTDEEKKEQSDFCWPFAAGFEFHYQNGKDIRIYRSYNLLKSWTIDAIKRKPYRKKTIDAAIGASGGGFCYQAVGGALEGGSYLVVGILAIAGGISVGNVVRLAGCLKNLLLELHGITSNLEKLAIAARRQASTLEMLVLEDEMYKGKLPVEKRSDNEYEIEFRDVSFCYPGAEEYALRHFSLKLKIGEKLAIVGMNGSGKTTMIKLLCRLYDPQEGEILLNGVNIKKFKQEEYSRLFSVVFQDFSLFSLMLAQNVAVNVDFDEGKVEKCLEDAGFGERLAGWEQGLATYLYKDYEDSGVEISGGEGQKIALARAIYKEAPFILLDEPTAALDPLAEYEIYTSFDKIAGNKTAIYISHRLSSCKFCDKIAVFHKGQLVQLGNHDELVADTNGKYYEMWEAQAQYYRKKGMDKAFALT